MHNSGVEVVGRGPKDEADLAEGDSPIFPQKFHENLDIFLEVQNITFHLFDVHSALDVGLLLLNLNEVSKHEVIIDWTFE